MNGPEGMRLSRPAGGRPEGRTPLLLGFGDGENFIASGVTALIRHTRDIAYMDGGELAILSHSGIRVYDRQLRPVEKKHHHVDWERWTPPKRAAMPTSCSRRSWSSPPPSAKATAARIQGAAWCCRT